MSPYIKDLFERVILTGLEAFLAVFTVTDLSSAEAGAIAAAAAILALCKGIVAQAVGAHRSASLVD